MFEASFDLRRPLTGVPWLVETRRLHGLGEGLTDVQFVADTSLVLIPASGKHVRAHPS